MPTRMMLDQKMLRLTVYSTTICSLCSIKLFITRLAHNKILSVIKKVFHHLAENRKRIHCMYSSLNRINTLLEKQSKFPRYNMKSSGKQDTTSNIPRSITFSPLHFMLHRGKSITLGTVHDKYYSSGIQYFAFFLLYCFQVEILLMQPHC